MKFTTYFTHMFALLGVGLTAMILIVWITEAVDNVRRYFRSLRRCPNCGSVYKVFKPYYCSNCGINLREKDMSEVE